MTQRSSSNVRDRTLPYRALILASALFAGTAALALEDARQPSRPNTCPEQLQGAWTGELALRDLVQVRLTIRESTPGSHLAEIASSGGTEAVPVWTDGAHLRFQPLSVPIAFDGVPSADGSSIGGFIRSASTVTRVELPRQADSKVPSWTIDWSPLGILERSLRFDLYIGDDGAGGVGGFFFFRDQRLPGLWGYGLACEGSAVELGEKTLGLTLAGELDDAGDRLRLTVTGPAGSAPIVFEQMPEASVPSSPDAPLAPARPSGDDRFTDVAPENLGEGWPTARASELGLDPGILDEMVRAIAGGEWEFTHSVLVARRGTLAVEEYFYGFDREVWHDMRSASKTFASTLIGIAIDGGLIANASAPALSLLPRYRRYDHWDPRKAEITVADLLNMSSGLDANDFDPQAVASEGAYQSQTARRDWVKLALDAPMVADPGSPPPVYGGANPLILGGILSQVAEEPVEWFAHRTLFGPLGVDHYKFVLDPAGTVYMGGGLHLRPRDMLKYGQLYLNTGTWGEQRLLGEQWVRESWIRRGRLAQFHWDHEYGYLWWHYDYQVDGRTVRAVEARGNGGQYISVIPALDLVIVITGGNYRNGKTRQPEEILQQYVLPAALAAESR